MAVAVGAMEIPVPAFILKDASQEFNLLWTCDCVACVQHDYWQDGSLYISMALLDDNRRTPFVQLLTVLTVIGIKFACYNCRTMRPEKQVLAIRKNA